MNWNLFANFVLFVAKNQKRDMTWAEEENDDYTGFNIKDVIYFYVCLQWLIVGPGGLSAPPEVAFAMRSWPLLSPTFSLPISLSLYV